MLNLLLNRRSIRTYKANAVTEEQLQSILQAGLLSPSSRGRKPWEFIVVQDREMLRQLGACRHPQQAFLPQTPLAIVVLGDTAVTDVWIEDCSIAMICMQLEAQQLGLGSCWVQIRNRQAQGEQQGSSQFIKTLLHIPEQYEVLAILAVGQADEKKEPYQLEHLDYQKIHREQF